MSAVMRAVTALALALGLLWGIASGSVPEAVAAEGFVPEVATAETLPDGDGHAWFWLVGSRIPSSVDGRAFLMDETGAQLGQLSTGFWFTSLVNAHARDEILTVETYFSRGTHGERTDVVMVYDPRTLSPKREIVIPPKRMNAVKNEGIVNLTEDERFLVVVNYTPAQSISIVDLDAGTFVEEVETPGCASLYAAGPRDFHAICGNGTFMHIGLDADGRVVSRSSSERLFDPVDDFLTIGASRIGDTWYFVSRRGNVHAFRMDGATIEKTASWSLTSDAERKADWGISGFDHTGAHVASGQLFVLMHQGPPESFEEPGTHVWVYDVATQRKVREIELREPTISIDVSQGDAPRLHTLDLHIPMNWLSTLLVFLFDGEETFIELARQRANVYDAVDGEHLFASQLVPDGGFVTQVQTW